MRQLSEFDGCTFDGIKMAAYEKLRAGVELNCYKYIQNKHWRTSGRVHVVSHPYREPDGGSCVYTYIVMKCQTGLSIHVIRCNDIR